MERRLIEEAKTPSEAASLQRIFDLRRRILRRFLLFATAFPAVVLVISLVVFGGQADSAQKLPTNDDHISDWHAEDERLIDHIRKYYLYQPAPRSEPYNLLAPNKRDYSHKKQSTQVDKILGGKRNGFFFEAGAYDGETYSNSLYFEKHLNWTGVMVEPDLANIEIFLKKKRKSYLVRGCIGSGNKPEKVSFFGAMETGTLVSDMNNARYWLTKLWRPISKFDTWCWPLISIFKAVNRLKMDYFVLDVEGHEMPILEGMDWSKVDVNVFQVEYMVFMGTHWDKTKSNKKLDTVRNYFKRSHPDHKERDRIFLDLIYSKTDARLNPSVSAPGDENDPVS